MSAYISSRSEPKMWPGTAVAVQKLNAGEPQHVEILDEMRFKRMLCLERMRSDRSGRTFVLLLLETASLPQPEHLNAFLRALGLFSRETDFKGWYREDRVFGVIFTEIGDYDVQNVITVLRGNTEAALSAELSPREISMLQLSFHAYPEKPHEGGTIGRPDPVFYPDGRPSNHVQRFSRAGKRAIDVAGSLAALMLLSPVLLLIAAAIKLTSKGPALFTQERIGRHGQPFTFLKFRSMYIDCDHKAHRDYVTRLIAGTETSSGNGAPCVFKIQNDPRITPIGRLLRRSSLDELPQLLNVLKGDMSLVGPRPPLRYEVGCYQRWHRHRILWVKPGITGLWQVIGRSRVGFDDMVRLDLEYANTQSLTLDLKILLKTPLAVIAGTGAY